MRAEYEHEFTEVHTSMTLSYKVKELKPGFKYEFKVACTNRIGISDLSDPSTKILTALKPGSEPLSLELIKRSE